MKGNEGLSLFHDLALSMYLFVYSSAKEDRQIFRFAQPRDLNVTYLIK